MCSKLHASGFACPIIMLVSHWDVQLDATAALKSTILCTAGPPILGELTPMSALSQGHSFSECLPNRTITRLRLETWPRAAVHDRYGMQQRKSRLTRVVGWESSFDCSECKRILSGMIPGDAPYLDWSDLRIKWTLLLMFRDSRKIKLGKTEAVALYPTSVSDSSPHVATSQFHNCGVPTYYTRSRRPRTFARCESWQI
jgi:hypothetical protein